MKHSSNKTRVKTVTQGLQEAAMIIMNAEFTSSMEKIVMSGGNHQIIIRVKQGEVTVHTRQTTPENPLLDCKLIKEQSIEEDLD